MPSVATRRWDTKAPSTLKRNTPGRWPIEQPHTCPPQGVHSRELPFWICETRSEWSSFDRKLASRDGRPPHEIMVPCRRFASVLEEFGVPYYLKVDIEGADILCLQDLNPQRLPKFMSMEVGPHNLVTLMAGTGFKRL